MTLGWRAAGTRRALLVAHRGASDSAPENTLPAVEAALEAGVDAIEIDVQRTADGVVVLVHDDTWQRTAGLAASVREVSWERARTLDAGGWFGGAFRGVPPPQLDDVLEVVRGRAKLDIEIKSPERDAGLAGSVVERVRRHAMQRQVVLTSFHVDTIDVLASSVHDIPLGRIAEQPLARGPAPVSLHAYAAPVILGHPAVVDTAHRAGIAVWAWTVDDAPAVQRLLDAGVDGVVTNRPAFAASLLA